MKVVIEFRRRVEEIAEMEIEVTEQEMDDYFREAGDEWSLRQPLLHRLDLFATDNEEALLKANPITRDQIDVSVEKLWRVERVTRSEEE
tara:strand:+ start:223 stop:489 length:267 start_codon:yes stop_codon:yes gene_type:complete